MTALVVPPEQILADIDATWIREHGPARPLAPHGTHAAYNRHVQYRQIPCIDCQEGERVYSANRKPNDTARTAEFRRLVAAGVNRRTARYLAHRVSTAQSTAVHSATVAA